jgi:hypothetical protein
MYTKTAVQNKLTQVNRAISLVSYHIKQNDGRKALEVLEQLKEYSEDIQTLINRESQQ